MSTVNNASKLFTRLVEEGFGEMEVVLRNDGEASFCYSFTGAVDSRETAIRVGVTSTENEDAQLYRQILSRGDSFGGPSIDMAHQDDDVITRADVDDGAKQSHHDMMAELGAEYAGEPNTEAEDQEALDATADVRNERSRKKQLRPVNVTSTIISTVELPCSDEAAALALIRTGKVDLIKDAISITNVTLENGIEQEDVEMAG